MHRRTFLKAGARAALTAATAPAWLRMLDAPLDAQAIATGSSYKAVVLVSMLGGNDNNNLIVPLASSAFNQYASLRSSLALPQGSLIPVTDSASGASYGFHGSLPGTAKLFSTGKALLVANVGPLLGPSTKTQLLANASLLPSALQDHAIQRSQWESAETTSTPDSGWGGRIADLLTNSSGTLPLILDAGPASIFTVGRTVQGIVVPTGSSSLSPLPSALQTAVLSLAQSDALSSNHLVAAVAQLRVQATQQQVAITQATTSGRALATQFPCTPFGTAMQSIAQVINGRQAIGASRQMFYCVQGTYDTHVNQLGIHAANLAEFDGGVTAFMAALTEMGLANNVLVCTHSDFGRTMQVNTAAGSDHGWGGHQLIFGGGIRGGRIVGTMPDLDLGGSSDLTGQGVWIPTLSVSQMTSPIAAWMGLSQQQIGSVFPDLSLYPSGAISLT